ncbi:hypothetical protein J6590_003682 [Homalodisca vitripennis]|nr:hypothetical protein J6590_003682 [Homalodisca vitripennis]
MTSLEPHLKYSTDGQVAETSPRRGFTLAPPLRCPVIVTGRGRASVDDVTRPCVRLSVRLWLIRNFCDCPEAFLPSVADFARPKQHKGRIISLSDQ